jgi:hypothetical protein
MLGADPSIIRIVWALLVVLTGGLGLLVYIVMAIVVPEAPPGHAQASRAAADTPTADGDAIATAVPALPRRRPAGGSARRFGRPDGRRTHGAAPPVGRASAAASVTGLAG